MPNDSINISSFMYYFQVFTDVISADWNLIKIGIYFLQLDLNNVWHFIFIISQSKYCLIIFPVRRCNHSQNGFAPTDFSTTFIPRKTFHNLSPLILFDLSVWKIFDWKLSNQAFKIVQGCFKEHVVYSAIDPPLSLKAPN